MSAKREVYISVDVETSGPIPGEFSLLTIGACNIFDTSQVFSCELKPITSNYIAEALEVTGLSLSKLEKDGLAPAHAMEKFHEWVNTVVGKNAIAVFVGFNAAFDWSFINYYFHRYVGDNPFGFAALDIKSMYMGAKSSSWYQTRSSEISKDLNPSTTGDHDALHDAIHQAEIFRLIYKDFKQL